MLKKSWLFLLPLVASLLWVGAAPSHAAGESFKYLHVTATGCTTGAYTMSVDIEGLDGGGGYIAHTMAVSGGKIYMNEEAGISTNGVTSWSLFNLFSYGAVSPAGTWPIPQNQEIRIRTTVERPKGTVLSSWNFVVSGCNSSTVRFSGPTSDDADDDLVPLLQDRCPNLNAYTQNGCPMRARTLSLAARKSPKRVVGRLFSSGFPSLYVGRSVTVWKERPGPDKKVATKTTNSLGKFKALVGKGRYYATSPGIIVPSSGQVGASKSGTVRVR